MKTPLLATATLIIPATAFADQASVQPPEAPNVVALQQVVLEQVSAAIDWRTKWIAAQRAFEEQSKQVVDLTKQVADLKKAAEQRVSEQAKPRD